jgi:hypothetical protein
LTKHNAAWSETMYYGEDETVDEDGDDEMWHYWDYDDE